MNADRKLELSLSVVLLIAVTLWVVAAIKAQPAQAGAKANKRNYHRYTIAQLTAENPADWKHPLTHLHIEGRVDYVAREQDGDLHIRLCDGAACIVAECIPSLPCDAPKVGDTIAVEGIGRYDGESPGHHWWEVHPVEQIVEVKP